MNIGVTKIALREIAPPIVAAPRAVKRMLVVLSDAAACALATIISLYLRLGYLPAFDSPLIFALLFSVTLCLGVFWIGHAYRTLFRYVSPSTVRLLLRCVLLYAAIYAGTFTYYGVDGVPRTLGLLQPAILLIGVLLERTAIAQIIAALEEPQGGGEREVVLIYGSGSAGRQLLAALRRSREMQVAGFIDDDISLSGQMLDGVKVHRPSELGELIVEQQVSGVLLAIPSATRKRRQEIIEQLGRHNVHVRSVPGMLDLAQGRIRVSDLREIATDDLLARNRVAPNAELLRRNVSGKVVLVTGAGGSIGGELCRQLVESGPAKILLLDHSEFAIYSIHREIQALVDSSGAETEVVPLLGSVADRRLVEHVFATWRPETAFHAAAYKHVPLVEQNVVEAVRNNILGTLCVAQTAIRHRTSHFVLISTDKAVRPTSVMGATKRLAEQILQALTETQSCTCLSMVRFGNVLGSSGSVVPLFRAQAHAGGPVTVTHREMTRYFMLIPEAAQLVIQASAMAKGGEVFLLDMGEPVKIMDLARSVIALSGLTVRDADNPEGDVEIIETGLRPGEKLYEELLIDSTSERSDHPLILRANESFASWEVLEPMLDRLNVAIAANDEEALIADLRRLVPEFLGRTPASSPGAMPAAL